MNEKRPYAVPTITDVQLNATQLKAMSPMLTSPVSAYSHCLWIPAPQWASLWRYDDGSEVDGDRVFQCFHCSGVAFFYKEPSASDYCVPESAEAIARFVAEARARAPVSISRLGEGGYGVKPSWPNYQAFWIPMSSSELERELKQRLVRE